MDTSVEPDAEDFDITMNGGSGEPGSYSENWENNRLFRITCRNWLEPPNSVDFALAASQANFKSATGNLVCPIDETNIPITEA